MALKIVLAFALVATIAAQYHHLQDEHYDAPAQYQFAYGVKDGHTGDIKEQEEKRDGHSVSGHYSLVEPDGHKRTVHYQDNGHGFEADVQRDGQTHEIRHEINAQYGHGGVNLHSGHSTGESYASVNLHNGDAHQQYHH